MLKVLPCEPAELTPHFESVSWQSGERPGTGLSSHSVHRSCIDVSHGAGGALEHADAPILDGLPHCLHQLRLHAVRLKREREPALRPRGHNRGCVTVPRPAWGQRWTTRDAEQCSARGLTHDASPATPRVLGHRADQCHSGQRAVRRATSAAGWAGTAPRRQLARHSFWWQPSLPGRSRPLVPLRAKRGPAPLTRGVPVAPTTRKLPEQAARTPQRSREAPACLSNAIPRLTATPGRCPRRPFPASSR